jgi:phenylpyruvate tautomerase PptA (4-oxalocrotonate tautomerase family)
VPPETLAAVRRQLVDELQAAVGCDRSWFTVELVQTRYFGDEGPVEGDPFVEVLWFRRAAEIRKVVAAVLARRLKRGEGPVTVVFHDLAAGDYYEDGEPV